MFSMIFDGRYIIALMGFFSIYAGLIYNDLFSKSISLFTSMFNVPNKSDGMCSLFSPGYVYPLGFDPKWNHASNNLNFTNAVKLKLSIVIAILHMNLGICLSAVNYFHEKDWQSLVFHFLPQFLFFNCLFGYMGWMIVWKWITGIDRSILNTFIAMMMQLGSVDISVEVPFFAYQAFIQRCLVIIALLCVPVMIFGRPIYAHIQKKRIHSLGYQEANQSGGSLNYKSPESSGQLHSAQNLPNDHEEQDFGSMTIHESIHAIEFLLGSVSNTASYLRLWALSLAHAQLSEVLWSLCLEGFMFNPATLIFGFAIWFFATMGLMVAMEGLSAFLHALRLHWVEFNSKFYQGQGVPFEPFYLNLATGDSRVIAAAQPVQF
jgi:V-type H+-transporting ATPase subunit a